jgi:rod shape-determining protein MreD
MSGQRPGVRQRPSIWRRLDQWARYGFPAACTLALILVLEAPLGLGIAPQLQLALTLASVFFWSVYRPASMPAFVGFALGLLIDLLQSQPIGLSSLVLLIVTGVARHWRHDLRRQGFMLGWLGFGLVAIGAVAVIYIGTSVLRWMLLPIMPSLAELVLALAFYPLLALLFAHAHRGAAAPEEA